MTLGLEEFRKLNTVAMPETARRSGVPAPLLPKRRSANRGTSSETPSRAAAFSQRADLLSGGEQQMLAIGRALMSEPRLLLLDEPSLGLAPDVVERIAETVQRIDAEGTGVVLVEQNAAMALEIADRAYVLELGRVPGRQGRRALRERRGARSLSRGG